MKYKSIICATLISALLLGASGCNLGSQYFNPYSEFYSIRYDTSSNADMTIDFSTLDGTLVQNVKKIDAFSPTWNFKKASSVNYETLEQLKYLSEFKNESLRIDMAFSGGGIGETEGIKVGNVKDDNSWINVNELNKALSQNGVLPYFVMLGIPTFAQINGGKLSYPDVDKYTKFCSDVSSYFKENGQRIIYETWNEPDLQNRSYWTDSMRSFIDLNVIEALALKSGDPDAYVVEQGLCWPVDYCNDYVNDLAGTYWDYYMKETQKAGNHIDAFSWHYYGDSYGRVEGTNSNKDSFSYYKKAVRDAINRDNATYGLNTMTQHVTEYANSKAGSGKIVATGLIPNIYESIEEAYASTDISRFSWAYFVGTQDYALVNPYSWKKTPSFYVHWTLGRLPLAPATVTAKDGLDDTFGWKTGVDEHRASAIIYNKTLNETYSILRDEYRQRAMDSRTVNVKIKNVPFDAKSLKVYLIDNEHVSYTTSSNKPYLIMDIAEERIKTDEVIIDLKLPGNSACYIEIDDGLGISKLDKNSNLESHIVRKDYYYEERADLMPYSDIHENSLSTSLGMLNHEEGKTAIMLTLDDMNQFNNLKLDYSVFGNLSGADENKAIGVRIDYHTNNGYVSSYDYYWRNYKNGFTYNGWGTGEMVETSRSFGNLTNGSYTIPLMQNSPNGWDGRVQITYYMVDAGQNVSATFNLNGVN